MDSLFCQNRIIYLFKVEFIEFGNLIKTYQFCHGINSFPGQGSDEIPKVGCIKLNKTKWMLSMLRLVSAEEMDVSMKSEIYEAVSMPASMTISNSG